MIGQRSPFFPGRRKREREEELRQSAIAFHAYCIVGMLIASTVSEVEEMPLFGSPQEMYAVEIDDPVHRTYNQASIMLDTRFLPTALEFIKEADTEALIETAKDAYESLVAIKATLAALSEKGLIGDNAALCGIPGQLKENLELEVPIPPSPPSYFFQIDRERLKAELTSAYYQWKETYYPIKTG